MVMVIAALAFIGIIVGALLTAVGYSYRLKLQDLNSRDNFYYVEQAMNEIYAGVGSEVVGDMQDAYIYTVENMVVYDFNTKSYVTKSDADVQKEFARRFMDYVKTNDKLTNAKIGDTLESYITNDSVVLDRSKIYVDYEKDPIDASKITKIIIKNVTLTRTQNYDKNVASGAYTQTISTDIEIGEPDFDVLFNSTNESYANIFKYSMVADMGIEVIQPTVPLTITGNVYAAADYYNKKYNESTYVVNSEGKYTVSDSDKKYVSGIKYNVQGTDADGATTIVTESADKYTHGSVTSKKYSNSIANNTYYNALSTMTNPAVAGSNDWYDGVLPRSMYSGIYVDGSDLTIMSDMVIVPGTVAVMNEGSLAIYGKNGNNASASELWADNIVLGGQSKKKLNSATDKYEYEGASAVLMTSTYVKDDTELNAAGSNFAINGRYFGYGDSTEKDSRVFIPTVDTVNFQVEVTGADGKVTAENRGHYNSSAIIINGQQSTLNLSMTETIFLAGRSYIELSKDVTENESDIYLNANGDQVAEGTQGAIKANVVSETYVFDPDTEDDIDGPYANNFVTADPDDTEFIRDYKTGESISLKTNQLAYIPIVYVGMPEAVYGGATGKVFQGYFEVELHVGLKDSALFEKYFPNKVFKDYKIPCVMQEISGKKYYYYDFKTAYDMMSGYYYAVGQHDTFVNNYPSAQYYASAFIVDYVKELNDEESVISEYLTDIGDFEDLEFDAGDIILPDYATNDYAFLYSSGAITTKKDTKFEIVHSDDWNQTALADLLLSTNDSYNSGLLIPTGTLDADDDMPVKYSNAYVLSNDLEMEYNLVKWNLDHYDNTGIDNNEIIRNQNEITYIQNLVQDADYGEASITPINKYLNMNTITEGTTIMPAINDGDSGNTVLDLASGYSVWVDYDDVTIKARNGDDGIVRGVIVTKGDVYFDVNVKSFEGLIVSGGKVFITGNLTNMFSSPAICQAVLRECMLLDNDNAKFLLNLFKGYEIDEDAVGGGVEATPGDSNPSTEAKTIDSIDYSDVCRFSNWMKNVE